MTTAENIPVSKKTRGAAGQGFSARVRLRTLVNIRWIAVAEQFISLLAVYFALEFQFDLIPALTEVALSALFTLDL